MTRALTWLARLRADDESALREITEAYFTVYNQLRKGLQLYIRALANRWP